MKKLIVASMIVMMTATAGVVASPIIATGLTELIADELIVDETQSEQINVAYNRHKDNNNNSSDNSSNNSNGFGGGGHYCIMQSDSFIAGSLGGRFYYLW